MARRIESKTSRTAEWTCLIRALSYCENREQYKSGDYVSVMIIPQWIKRMMGYSLFRRFLIRQNPKGMYEYVIARTKQIDHVVAKALEEGCEQVLIFGAGFDSRAVRFHGLFKSVRIFEIDVPVTQSAKIERYREKGIGLPDRLVFIPIDFDKQSIFDRLAESGFEKGKKSLFVLEGLTMYLQPESVDKTFKIIREYAGPGSGIVFDYIRASVLRKENVCYGEEDMLRRVSRVNEAWYFGMEKEEVREFLSRYGFEIVEHMDARDLENRFFTDAQGKVAERMNGTHCIVTAIKNA